MFFISEYEDKQRSKAPAMGHFAGHTFSTALGGYCLNTGTRVYRCASEATAPCPYKNMPLDCVSFIRYLTQ